MKLLLTLALLLTACATNPAKEPAEKPEEKAEPCAAHSWCYVKETKDALSKYGKELLAANPKDYKEYCGAATKLDCYDAILHAMSVYESGITPTQVYTEKFDVDGNKCATSGKPCVKSVGLMQVSIASCQSYGSSAKTTEELLTVEKNLECAVRILNRQVPRDNVIAGGSKGAWRGGSRYWAVLRDHVPEIKQKATGYLQ